MHEKVSPFVSKTLSKITTIIYISTKISGFKNSCNEKKGFHFFFLLTVKNDTVDQKSAKYAMKKINLHLKRFTLLSSYFLYKHQKQYCTSQHRFEVSQPFKMCYIQVSEHLRGQAAGASMPQGRISSVIQEQNKTFMFPSFQKLNVPCGSKIKNQAYVTTGVTSVRVT